MAAETKRKFEDLVREFETAMLVTQALDGEMRARPMVIADVEDGGTIWFLTQRGSAKVQEIGRDHHVNVVMQSQRVFISISGSASPVENRAKVAELWNEAWKIWFPGGKDDPELMLMRVQGEQGEYWDNSGASGLKYLLEAGKAYFSGTKPDVARDPNIHGKVNL